MALTVEQSDKIFEELSKIARHANIRFALVLADRQGGYFKHYCNPNGASGKDSRDKQTKRANDAIRRVLMTNQPGPFAEVNGLGDPLNVFIAFIARALQMPETHSVGIIEREISTRPLVRITTSNPRKVATLIRTSVGHLNYLPQKWGEVTNSGTGNTRFWVEYNSDIRLSFWIEIAHKVKQ